MIPEHTQLRNRAARTAREDPHGALRLARQIEEPWFRCQALAHAARWFPDSAERELVLKESFAAALETEDLNPKVAVSSWPLKVLCRLGLHERLAAEAERLLALAAQEPSPIRRADALDNVLGAVVTGPRHIFDAVFTEFRAACLAPLRSGNPNKRGQKHLAIWAAVINIFDRPLAQEIVQSIERPHYRQLAEEWISKLEGLDVETACTWPNID